MKQRFALGELRARLVHALLSVPIYFKILGIGALVAVIFGGVTLYQTYHGMSRILYGELEQKTVAMAQSLAVNLERPLVTGDLFTVQRKLRKTQAMSPSMRYIIVRDRGGRIVAHTFGAGVPKDLRDLPVGHPLTETQVEVLRSKEGLIFDVTCPILETRAGILQVGVTDRMITRGLASITKGMFWALLVCFVLGQGLALALTHLLTHPIRQLVEMTRRIRQGEFEARTEIFADDETGKLGDAFNQMAQGLQDYRREVGEKEAARQALIEKIVFAQEEERKNVARELHDQFGQSLSNTLLQIESRCKDCPHRTEQCQIMKDDISGLIDEVRQLAWDMRPSILDDYGLDVSLQRYVEEMSNRLSIPIDYQGVLPAGEKRLPPQVEVSLYRITQEAITNIMRHAKAERASVVLLCRESEVTLMVEDNGQGFDAALAQRDDAKSLGVMGMRERANLLGGDLAIESQPGHGTTVRIRLPLEKTSCQSES